MIKHFMYRASYLLLLCFLMLAGNITTLAAQENLTFNLKSFSESVIAHNRKIQINQIDPQILYANYLNQKHQSTPSSLNFTTTYEPLLASSTMAANLEARWQTQFLSGTTLSVGLGSQFLRPSANDESWLTAFPAVSVTQKLLNGGFIKNYNHKTLYSNLYNARASDATYRHFVTTTLFNALITYHQFLINKELLTLYQSDLKDVKNILKFNERKSRLGALLKRDLLSSEILVLEAQRALETTQSTLDRIKNQLFNFIGKTNSSTQTNLTLTDSISLEKPKIDKAVALENSLNIRPDYQALLTQLANANNTLQVAKLSRLPSLDLTAGLNVVGREGNSLADSYNRINWGSSDNYNLSLGLAFSVRTDAKWYKSTVRSAKLDLAKTELQLVDIKQDIASNLNNNLISLEELYKIFRNNQRILALTQDRYALIRKDYYDGLIDFATNVNAKRELVRARAATLNSKLAYESTLLELQYLTGDLYERYNIAALSNANLFSVPIKK